MGALLEMNRKCPACSAVAVSVSALVVSDVQCTACDETIGVQWLFRTVFFILTLIATIVVGFVVMIDQGLYAGLLMISLPIGAIGYVKARYSPLVVRKHVHNHDRAARTRSNGSA